MSERDPEHAKRTVVVTGAASGIGRATAALVELRGWRPIRVDRVEGGDVRVDLATSAGRTEMLGRVAELTGGRLDAVIACAGVNALEPITVSVNYFGMVTTLEGLRPLLARGLAPRAVGVASIAALLAPDPAIAEACLAGDEAAAVTSAAGQGPRIYASSKAAFVRWMRRSAIAPDWIGAGILLNAVAPAVIITPMMQPIIDDPAVRAELDRSLPMPIGRYGQPAEVAELLVWLASPANSLVVGQVIFADGGAEALGRGERAW
jgi:NAD(P)-dependent dehydrogenase (short-subunit alcohol dehydrogenase family)